jgi:hypothetical protein
MNTLTQTRTAIDDEITHAMYDAICDGEGHSNAFYLKHHLAKHGLVIVEAARHDKLLTTLQLVLSALESEAPLWAIRNAVSQK